MTYNVKWSKFRHPINLQKLSNMAWDSSPHDVGCAEALFDGISSAGLGSRTWSRWKAGTASSDPPTQNERWSLQNVWILPCHNFVVNFWILVAPSIEFLQSSGWFPTAMHSSRACHLCNGSTNFWHRPKWNIFFLLKNKGTPWQQATKEEVTSPRLTAPGRTGPR